MKQQENALFFFGSCHNFGYEKWAGRHSTITQKKKIEDEEETTGWKLKNQPPSPSSHFPTYLWFLYNQQLTIVESAGGRKLWQHQTRWIRWLTLTFTTLLRLCVKKKCRTKEERRSVSYLSKRKKRKRKEKKSLVIHRLFLQSTVAWWINQIEIDIGQSHAAASLLLITTGWRHRDTARHPSQVTTAECY